MAVSSLLAARLPRVEAWAGWPVCGRAAAVVARVLTSRCAQPKAKAPKEEGEVQKSALAAQLKEGEIVFGVAHLFASFNDTFVVRPRFLPALALSACL